MNKEKREGELAGTGETNLEFLYFFNYNNMIIYTGCNRKDDHNFRGVITHIKAKYICIEILGCNPLIHLKIQNV